jgi:hypothetical protein
MRTHDPAVQSGYYGYLTEAFLDRFFAAKEKHRLPGWRIADLAKWSASYLGNATRRNDQVRHGLVHVHPDFAERLKAVIERLEAVPPGSDLSSQQANSVATVAAPITVSLPAPEEPPVVVERTGEAAQEVPGSAAASPADVAAGDTVGHALAILRKHGVRAVTLEFQGG